MRKLLAVLAVLALIFLGAAPIASAADSTREVDVSASSVSVSGTVVSQGDVVSGSLSVTTEAGAVSVVTLDGEVVADPASISLDGPFTLVVTADTTTITISLSDTGRHTVSVSSGNGESSEPRTRSYRPRIRDRP